MSEFSSFNILSKEYVKLALANLNKADTSNFSDIITKITNALNLKYMENKRSELSFFQKFFSEIVGIRNKINEKKISEQIYQDLIDKRIILGLLMSLENIRQIQNFKFLIKIYYYNYLAFL